MDYLDLFALYPNPMSLLLLLLLGMMRFGPIVIQAPFLGAQILPTPVKIFEILTFSVIFLPKFIGQVHEPLLFDMYFVGLALKEILIGTLLGFLASVPFFIATTSGTIIDHQRGSSSLIMTDPSLGLQASPLGQLYTNVLIVTFFLSGAFWVFFGAIDLSFDVIPINAWVSRSFFQSLHVPFWADMIDMASTIFMIAVMMASPPLVSMFMSDLFLGIANRMATQVPMSFLGWALKSLIGIAILWLGWFFILNQLNIQTFKWLGTIDEAVQNLAFGG